MHSESYGKAKLVLRKNQHFVEACDMATMNKLQSFECIKQSVLELQRENEQKLRRAQDQSTIDTANTKRAEENFLRMRREQGYEKEVQEKKKDTTVIFLEKLQKEFQVFQDIEMSDQEEEKHNDVDNVVGVNSLVKKMGSNKYQLQVFSGDGGKFIETIKQQC